MEAFSLLKYWRGGGSSSSSSSSSSSRTATVTATATATAITTADSFSSSSSSASTTTIVTAVSPRSSDDDEGPFFDLQLAHHLQEEENEKKQTVSETINIINVVEDEEEVDDDDDEDDDDEEEEEEQQQQVVGNDESKDTPPPPSGDNIFFKGSFVPIEPSTLLHGKRPTSLSKSAAKFRVLMLKLKKSKENISGDEVASLAVTEKENNSNNNQTTRKFFTVKFINDGSRRAAKARGGGGGDGGGNTSCAEEDTDEENKFLKDVMHKYLKMVKPLHNIRISKLKLSGQLMRFSGTEEMKAGGEPTAEVAAATASGTTNNVRSLKRVGNNLSTGLGLRVVCKHLGKSKSASLATTATSAPVAAAPSASRRRDDSLIQQQDGIQSAILHCKRSFNASRDAEISILSRSASDTSNEKSSGLSTVTCSPSKEANVC